jgi:hypothetical protein
MPGLVKVFQGLQVELCTREQGEAKRAFLSLKKHTQKSSSCKGIQRLEGAVHSGVRETCHFFTYYLVKSVGCTDWVGAT